MAAISQHGVQFQAQQQENELLRRHQLTRLALEDNELQERPGRNSSNSSTSRPPAVAWATLRSASSYKPPPHLSRDGDLLA